ncbi:histidine kinase [Planococcus sp. N028]|uniref:Histidine kinase n=1 Tax=Planococcus shixiaomingii TaxID=3058393 RepID=A0ABT8MZA7_9BACL|nr:histidine kinase [Planococcus sp. N028]MDN7240974.1 histidine kinase [Planococcus sp. N028]
MLNEKQELLFKELKGIKDLSVLDSESFLESPKKSPLVEEYELLHRKLNSEEDKKAFSKVQNEVVETVIYRVMEMIDGYGSLPFSVDLIDKEKNESLRKSGELHDGFMNHLYENEKQEK